MKPRYVVYTVGDYYEVFDAVEKITKFVFTTRPKAIALAIKLNNS